MRIRIGREECGFSLIAASHSWLRPRPASQIGGSVEPVIPPVIPHATLESLRISMRKTTVSERFLSTRARNIAWVKFMRACPHGLVG